MHPHDTPNGANHPGRLGGGRRKKYGRNSTDEQREQCTIISQREEVDAWDRAHGGTPRDDDWYIDEGWSGFTMVRPALDRLRDDARNPDRDWHELIVYDTSRLSREPYHRMYILEPELKALGITLIYVASPVYPDNADGHAMAGMQGVFDRWFAEKTRENLRRGLHSALRSERVWWAPYGYRVERLVPPDGGRATFVVSIYEPEAEIVREIYALVIAGHSAAAVARILNARGVKSAKGGQWWPRTINGIIHDRYYTGQAVHGRTQRVLPKKRRDSTPTHQREPRTGYVLRPQEQWTSEASVPVIVAREVQEQAEAVLALNQRRCAQSPAQPYPLRGLLRCTHVAQDGAGTADYTLYARTRKWDGGSERRYYRCGYRAYNAGPGEHRSCSTELWADEVEDLIWRHLKKALLKEDLRAAFERLRAAPAKQRAQWEDAIRRLDAERTRIRDRLRTQQKLLEDGRYTWEEYELARGDTLPEIKRIEDGLVQAKAELAAIRTSNLQWEDLEALCLRLRPRMEEATPAEREVLLRQLLHSIHVHPDHFEIAGILKELDGAVARAEVSELGTARNGRSSRTPSVSCSKTLTSRSTPTRTITR